MRLKDGTKYLNGYDENHPVIKMFWNVLAGWSEIRLRAFLAFVTGNDRVPVAGLENLGLTIARTTATRDHLPGK